MPSALCRDARRAKENSNAARHVSQTSLASRFTIFRGTRNRRHRRRCNAIAGGRRVWRRGISPRPAPAASISKISLEEVAELRKLAEGAEQISDKDLAAALDLYDKAASKLTEAKRLSESAEALRRELADVAVQLEQAQAEAAAYDAAKVDPPPAIDGDPRTVMAEADNELTKTRELLQQIVSEIDHRKTRRQSIPEMMAVARQQLAEIEQTLKTGAVVSESPELTKANQVVLLARREFRQREVDSLDQEMKTYDGTTRVWLLRRDNAERKLKIAQRRRDSIQALVAAKDRQEADKQVRQASRAAANAHPAVKGAAATKQPARGTEQAIGRQNRVDSPSVGEDSNAGRFDARPALGFDQAGPGSQKFSRHGHVAPQPTRAIAGLGRLSTQHSRPVDGALRVGFCDLRMGVATTRIARRR